MAMLDRKNLPVGWVTVRYIYLRIFFAVIFVIAAIIIYAILSYELKKHSDEGKRGASADAAVAASSHHESVEVGRVASFAELNGDVKLRDATGAWSAAASESPVTIGEVVQTGEESSAKLMLADGSACELSPNTLLQLTQNVGLVNGPTHLVLQLVSGAIKLTTSELHSGSTARVDVSGSTVDLASQTSATILKSKTASRYEVLVTSGSAQLTHNNEIVALSPYLRVGFQADAGPIATAQELAPPALNTPRDKEEIPDDATKMLQLTWDPVPQARGYRVILSRSRYLSNPVVDKPSADTELRVARLGEGTYYWTVRSFDASGRLSTPGDVHRFRIPGHAAE